MADVRKIQKGQADWHIPLNANFAAINGELSAPSRYELVATGGAQLTAANPYGVTAVLTAGNLDTGIFTVGKNYYVFVSIENDVPIYLISLNKKYATGHLIGGFHYGLARRTNATLDPVNTSGINRGNGWEATIFEGIVPRSVWTLSHRPKCSPEGMVYLTNNTWVDIYLSSDDGAGGLASAYNAMLLTGTEGLNWYDFVKRALVSGKRLPSYSEFCQYAFGSPSGQYANNTNAWAATTNTAKQRTGYVANAVSSIGCRDAVGNVWEWQDELITRAIPSVITGAGTFGATDGARAGKSYTNGNGHGTAAAPAWGYDTYSPFPDGYGNIYQGGDHSLIALAAGGLWNSGANAGARTVSLYYWPWGMSAGIGARCACDSL